eukprot:5787766-Amphidinium_carterae.3
MTCATPELEPWGTFVTQRAKIRPIRWRTGSEASQYSAPSPMQLDGLSLRISKNPKGPSMRDNGQGSAELATKEIHAEHPSQAVAVRSRELDVEGALANSLPKRPWTVTTH